MNQPFSPSHDFSHTEMKLDGFQVIREQDTQVIEEWLSRGKHIDEPVERDYTWLMLACYEQNRFMIEFVMNHHPDVGVTTQNGQNALGMLCGDFARSDLSDVALMLIEKGIDLHGVNQSGYTPLMWGGNRGHRNIVKLLIKQGASVHIIDKEGKNALILATMAQDDEVVQSLIQAGSELNQVDHEGKNALMHSIECGPKVACAKLLIQAGAEVNGQDKKGMTPLMWAVLKNKPELVKGLFESGAKLDLKNKNGQIASDLIQGDRQPEIVELFRVYQEKKY